MKKNLLCTCQRWLAVIAWIESTADSNDLLWNSDDSYKKLTISFPLDSNLLLSMGWENLD